MSKSSPAKDNTIPSFDDLANRWAALQARYAPKRKKIWSYGTAPAPKECQGWKIHLSATIVTACDLLDRCGEFLLRSQCPFKIATNLNEIRKLNAGTFYGRSQVGKVVTIYCPEPSKAQRLAEQLHQRIGALPCPEIPSDRRYRKGSNVFYRYGSYAYLRVKYKGRMAPAYRDPDGKLVPDLRTVKTAIPEWVKDPFNQRRDRRSAITDRSSLTKAAQYRATEIIHWRGSGGVYKVQEKTLDQPFTYIMKEGLRHGNTSLDGMDGLNFVRNEARVLRTLRDAGVPVPSVKEVFSQNGRLYVVLEYIEGRLLADVVDHGLKFEDALRIGQQACQIVSSIHKTGWAWRDCKLGNFIYDGAQLWAIDLEFAMRIGKGVRNFRSTPSYFLERPDPITGAAAVMQDRYALGVTLQRLFGKASEKSAKFRLRKPPLPSRIDPTVKQLIKLLQHKRPERRPSAELAAKLMGQCL